MKRTSLVALYMLVALPLVLASMIVDQASAQLLDPTTHPKFVNPLPIPGRIDATAGGRYDMAMQEVVQSLGLVDPIGNPLTTTVWGYGTTDPTDPWPVTYPGPTFVTMRDVPIDVKWKNMLPKYNWNYPGLGGHLLPVDPTLHMAHPSKSGIPTVVHLHGGHTESASDGLPEAWYTQGFKQRGPQWVKKQYHYDNDQEAATLWYHDHALGITRLNVYAGLAGFYLLRDTNENGLIQGGVLPGGPYEIEIVIQDRMFTDTGALFYPSTDPEIEPGFDPFPANTPSAIAEFFGDFILVNGAAWPKLDVEPRKYRLRFLNGSDSRFYVLEFHSGGVKQSFMQIGTDDGLLETPVAMETLLLAPGERVDLVVDFDGLSEVVLKNFGPDEPFKGFNPDGTVNDGAGGVAPPADPNSTGLIMKFNVNLPMSGVPDATVGMGTNLRPNITALAQDGATRQLVLFEGLDNYGRLQPLLGTLAAGSKSWFEPITENPMVDDVEVWEVYNATEDAHPIHLHLVAFQIINRESFDGDVEEKAQTQHDGSEGVGGILTVNSLGGDARGPEPNEVGWKDTAVMLPGEVTRVIAKFDREGRYVWHCHILSHEDHEMMRPYYVGTMPALTASAQGVSGATRSVPDDLVLGQNTPNPFNPVTQIPFALPAAGHVELKIYDVAGRLVRALANTGFSEGAHVMTWDGKDDAGRQVATGVYFYQLSSGGITQVKKMVMTK